MRAKWILLLGLGVSGCAGWPTAVMPPSYPAAAPVIRYQWITGFVPIEMARSEFVEIRGDGAWKAWRQNASGSVDLASGAIPTSAVSALMSQASSAPSLFEPSFMALPERPDSRVMDAPTRVLSVTYSSASHSVTVSGDAPTAFTRLESAIAAQTVSLPRPE